MKASQQPHNPVWGRRKPRLAGRLLLLALALGVLPAAAQMLPGAAISVVADSIPNAVALPPAELDSLAAVPLVVPVDSARLLWLQTPATLAELVGDRMGCIDTDAPHHFNPAVLAFVRLFTERQRGYTQHALEREQVYFPIFEKYLAQYNLPTDLKYLSVVESALLPTAKSPVGALGLWQFMPATAGDLRLKRDEWVDERMHPEKATEAACKHLRYLYGVFHDWELVLAAYNWGAGSMQRVMRRTGKKTFWELYPYLPVETRNYVPTFTAIMYAMKYAPEHNLRDPALHYRQYEPLDTLGLSGQPIDLRRLSRALGYDDSLAMAHYNPEVKRGGLPAGYRPYVLRYPSAAREQLAGIDRATLLAYCQPLAELPRSLPMRPVLLAGMQPWPTGQAEREEDTPAPAAAPATRRVYYTARRGQTVNDVAERFGVTPAQLRRWNDLGHKTHHLHPGRELVLLLPRLPDAAPVPAAPLAVAVRPAPDAAAQALAAANQRYARQAQETAEREAAQQRELLRAKRQQAARVVAQQREAARQVAVAAKAAQLAQQAEKARQRQQQAEALSATNTPEATDSAATVALAPAPRRNSHRPDKPATEPTARPTIAREPADAPAAPAASRTYTVQAGDNLTRLAREHDVSVAQLREWNDLPAQGGMQAGQRLRLTAPAGVAAAPAPVLAHNSPKTQDKAPTLSARHGSTHTVQPGDTLFNISRRFGLTVQELRKLNNLKSDDVKLGQKLVVAGS